MGATKKLFAELREKEAFKEALSLFDSVFTCADEDSTEDCLGVIARQKEVQYWQDLQSPVKLSRFDTAKQSGLKNDISIKNNQTLL